MATPDLPSSSRKRTRLKELFQEERTMILPLGALAIHAQMAERAGFGAFMISGAFTSWWLNGMPDVNLMTRSEVVENARRVVDAVDIPVYCDADTGYGGVQNVRQTVFEMCRAGVAGIQLEDQVEPKKAGSRGGVAVVSEDEAIGRFAAAVDARDELDPDFVIVARTDAYSASGGDVDETIRRCRSYKEHTGVDVLMVEALPDWNVGRTVLSEIPGPALVTTKAGAGESLSIAELSALGQAAKLLPFVAPGVQEVWRLLLEVARSGETTACDDYVMRQYEIEGEAYTGVGDVFVRPTYDQIRDWEQRYLPEARQRTYRGDA
jgi:methylisocitrate lyase